MIRLDEDHHVHSTFSDGRASVVDMALTARDRGLTELGFADHVRRESWWLPRYVQAVRRAREIVPGITLRIGVEAKVLDAHGTLDLPTDLTGIEQIVIADHQYPGDEGPVDPKLIRAALAAGAVAKNDVIDRLVDSTRRAVLAADRPVIIGHLFSILPKMGISHGLVDPARVEPLFDACLATNARMEVDERWRSPGSAVVERALARGVRVVASSDSHSQRPVGRYRYVADVAQRLAA